ncbi:MAG: phospholipase D-like domain-containing protein [Planctomyces sp.]
MTINATQHTPDHQIARELDRLLQPQQTAPREIQARAWFSPYDDCPREIRSPIATARNSIDLCVLTITDDRLTDSVLAAHQRGVSIRIITDNDKAAEHNEENFMVLNYQPLVMRYLEQFEILWNKLACFENC